MGQVDPNIVEVPHKEAYTIENPQRRSPSPKSPTPPPIIEEGDATQRHQVVDIVERRPAGASATTGEIRMEERPRDIIQTKKGKSSTKEARHVFEEGTSSGTLNLPYGSDDEEQE